jgi:hypothetical protein
MTLAMRTACERFGSSLESDRDALICSFECTFRIARGSWLDGVCPNCRGGLVLRRRGRMEPSCAWLDDLGAVPEPFGEVTLVRVVPGRTRYELVLTTPASPPEGRPVEELRDALGNVIRREDSPVVAREHDVDVAAWHFDPPADRPTQALCARLDWARAVVVRERSPVMRPRDRRTAPEGRGR